MSIQDENFPYDYDIEFSCNSVKSFVFPHRKPCRTNVSQIKGTYEKEVSSKQNTLQSSLLQNQNDSTQSSSDFCLSSETSGKTNGSEPNDLPAASSLESEKKKSELVGHNPNKSISYQDIHSEYTKRRYKHVESKVGRYIANMKAQDEKRRNSGKFQRHSSMPETLDGNQTIVTELNNDCRKHGLIRHSTNDLHHINSQHNDLQSDHDTDNYYNLTATTSSLSTRDSGSENGIYLDKQTYEQLLNDKERKDYLQSKLEEKNAENWRLKQNLDTMRIEYSMCKDKLKQQIQSQRFSGSYSSINAGIILGRTSSQSLLCPQETKDKFTQTDIKLTPSPVPPQNKTVTDVFGTPFTPDSNNNLFDHAAMGMLAPAAHKVSKTIATIQPLSLNFSNLVDQDFNNSNINTTMGFLRQRSNSLAMRKKSTPLPANISKSSSGTISVPSSSDSAIDVEVVASPKSQRRRRKEIIYYEQRSQRYAVIETRNAGQNYTDTENNASESNNAIESGMISSNRKHFRKRRTLRSRIARFFGACTKCDDPKTPLKSDTNSPHSQIPLLEKKYAELSP